MLYNDILFVCILRGMILISVFISLICGMFCIFEDKDTYITVILLTFIYNKELVYSFSSNNHLNIISIIILRI
jgi:hypothetical protein